MELTKNILIKEAQKIADLLITTAIKTDSGVSWKTHQSEDNEITWFDSDNLYNGTSGVALFLLELYNITKEEKYLYYAELSLKWVKEFTDKNSVTSHALLTGRTSVMLVFIRAYEITSDHAFLQIALNLSKDIRQFKSFKIVDYLNGISGSILGLIKLHEVCEERWILEEIEEFTSEVLNRTHLSKNGIYWDRSPIHIKGLCGFSHGASGVSYVFWQLGKYFSNDAFYWVAKQALIYENQFYDSKENNWKDLRNAIYNERDEKDFKENYNRKNTTFFTQGKFMNAWCHGAAGIGLTRSVAFEYTGEKRWLSDLHRSIEKTLPNASTNYSSSSFTLCHGFGGNAELFLEAFRLFNDKKYHEYATQIAGKSIESSRDTGHYRNGLGTDLFDPNLFLGAAGIGYYYLRVAAPQDVPSILNLKISNKSNAKLSDRSILHVASGEVIQIILKKEYLKTIQLLEYLFAKETRLFFEEAEKYDDFKGRFRRYTKEQIAKYPEKEILKDAFLFENAKVLANESVKSDSLLNYKEKAKIEDKTRLLKLIQSYTMSINLVLDSDIIIYESRWNWSSTSLSISQYLANEPGSFKTLIIPSYYGVRTLTLSEFSALLCEHFLSPKTLGSTLSEITELLGTENKVDFDETHRIIILQVEELVKSNILLDPAHHINRERPQQV